LGIGPHSSLVVFLRLLLLLLLLITTSGQSDLTKDCRLQFNRIHQVAPMCPPMWSHWRHLANTIELVLPSVHAGLQPNQQIDRFSYFCTAHGTVYSGIHWHHLANMIELVLPSAHRSPQPEWQIDQFSCFCTAHSRKSLYFTMANPFPQNFPFPWGNLDPHLTHGSLGPSEPTTQTASQSFHPFLHR